MSSDPEEFATDFSIQESDSSDPTEESEEKVPDAARLVAEQMVSAALAADFGLKERSAAAGALIVLRSPHAWREAVAAAWGAAVLGFSSMDWGSAESHWSRRQRDKGPLLTYLSGNSGARPSEVRSAMRSGRGVLAVAVADVEVEPRSRTLVRSADAEVPICPPTPAMLAAAAEALGTGRGSHLPAEVAAAVEPDHLACAMRPGQAAVDYLERVGRVVQATAEPVSSTGSAPSPSAAAWTLDTLPLPAAVEAWARQLVDDLAAYAAGDLAWEDIDHGALVTGPPGTGKTSFAGALAASAGLPLFTGSYSTWESGADGKGRYSELIKCMRQTFADARKAAPCILFVDEIDSFIGRGQGGHNESWFAPLTNALLQECDAAARPGVVLVAATNFPDRTDAALRRPGRLDRVLQLELPDAATLARIVAAHLPGLPPSACQQIAAAAGGGSGADIERLARGARRRARVARRSVEASDVLQELHAGNEIRTPARQRQIALHEAGHAVAMEVRAPGRVIRVTLQSPMDPTALGSVQSDPSLPDGDGVQALEGRIVEMLAGRAAEELVLGRAGAGAMHDLAQATRIAVLIEASFGLGGFLTTVGAIRSDDVLGLLVARPELAARVEERLQACYASALGLLRSNRVALDAVATRLVEREALSGAEVASLVRQATPRGVVGARPQRWWEPSRGGASS